MRIISVWLTLLCCAATASAQELKKIKIGNPAIAYNQIQIWVAKDAGLFRKHGLDAEIVFFRGGLNYPTPTVCREERRGDGHRSYGRSQPRVHPERLHGALCLLAARASL